MIAQTFRRSRIMIVDDEPAMVRLLEQLLERAGYTHLRSTTDPREVPTHYREFRPDLIMLDLRMPHLDGVQVLERLKRETSAEIYLPVLVLTADAAPEAKRRALAAGASDFVTKPFDRIELLLRVDNLLAMRFLHRSEEHTSELQSQSNLVCRLLLEKKKKRHIHRLDRSEQAYRTRSRRPANQNHP